MILIASVFPAEISICHSLSSTIFLRKLEQPWQTAPLYENDLLSAVSSVNTKVELKAKLIKPPITVNASGFVVSQFIGLT